LCPKLLQTPQRYLDFITMYKDFLTMYNAGKFADAYATFREGGMENYPQWYKIGDNYIILAELELRLNGDVRKAQELLDRAMEIGSFDESYYYRTHGYLMWHSGERKKAIQDLEKSVAAEANVFNLIALAQLLFEAGDKRATTVCQQILDKDPDNCLAHIYFAWDEAKSGDRDKALLMAKRAEELQQSADDLVEIGRLYHELEKFQSAINKYLEAEKLGYEEKWLLYAAISDCYLSLM